MRVACSLVSLVLAGCSSNTIAVADAAIEGGGDEPLEPLPAIDGGCYDNDQLAETGPCCESVGCYAPGDAGCMLDASWIVLGATGGYACGPVSGPYSWASSPDLCCYIVWSQVFQ